MKAYLINPHTKSVTEVDQTGQNDLYRLIDCQVFVAIPIPAYDTIYADDDNRQRTASFRYKGNSTPIYGIGVVVGSDEAGNDDIPAHSLKSLTARIEWLSTPATIIS